MEVVYKNQVVKTCKDINSGAMTKDTIDRIIADRIQHTAADGPVSDASHHIIIIGNDTRASVAFVTPL